MASPDRGRSPTVPRDHGRLTEALLAAQKQSLELVVTGAPLLEVLEHLTRTVEELSGGTSVAAIMLLDDEGCLRNAAAPSLPEPYLAAIDGLPASPGLGTCCSAAALGAPVVTPDFSTSPGWDGIAHLPIEIGFRGAWSLPIIARDGSVLGTLGTYFREIREPTAVEREVVEVLARTASIAIERGRAETALREREAFNRRLLESSADCIEVIDLDGRLLSINEVGMRLLQIDEDRALLGREYLAFWDGEDLDRARDAVAAAMAGGEGRFEGYCPTLRGEPRWWDVAITPIPNGDGKPYRLLAISRDITERRRTQDELRRAMEAAEAASDAKSQFLAVMSHELRTPLTGIIGYADLLSADIAGPTNDRQKSQISRIKSGAWHLVTVIDEILTFSRAEAGKEDVLLDRIDFGEVVRESVELLYPQASAKRIELHVHLPDETVLVDTDSGKLRQIVLNLAGNAVKFTTEGSVELTVSTAGDRVRLDVTDSGPGIPEGGVDRIFEPFVQGDQTMTRRQGGTGLGLAVCRSLAALLGGTVEVVHTVPGEGSTFRLSLPRRLPTAPAEDSPRPRVTS